MSKQEVRNLCGPPDHDSLVGPLGDLVARYGTKYLYFDANGRLRAPTGSPGSLWTDPRDVPQDVWSDPRAVPQDVWSQLRFGMSKQEVQNLWGPPEEIRRGPQGGLVARYGTRSLDFDAKGRLTEVTAEQLPLPAPVAKPQGGGPGVAQRRLVAFEGEDRFPNPLQAGMTKLEVRALLGSPDDKLSGGPDGGIVFRYGTMCLRFDANGRLTQVM